MGDHHEQELPLRLNSPWYRAFPPDSFHVGQDLCFRFCAAAGILSNSGVFGIYSSNSSLGVAVDCRSRKNQTTNFALPILHGPGDIRIRPLAAERFRVTYGQVSRGALAGRP